MPAADLIANDPLVSQNFFLEIDGEVITMLSGVSGLEIEVDVPTVQQVGKNGVMQTIKALGTQTKAPDLQLTRMAPADAANDAMWKWFNDVRDKGLKLADRSAGRKNGSVFIYDTTNSEIGRFNFYRAWPSKISTDALSVDSNEAVKETIVLVCERLERVK